MIQTLLKLKSQPFLGFSGGKGARGQRGYFVSTSCSPVIMHSYFDIFSEALYVKAVFTSHFNVIAAKSSALCFFYFIFMTTSCNFKNSEPVRLMLQRVLTVTFRSNLKSPMALLIGTDVPENFEV